MRRGARRADRVSTANPKGAALLERFRPKSEIAMFLRGLRMAREMTQDDVRLASEANGLPLTQPMISRMENPLGSMPNIDSIMRYVGACGGQLSLVAAAMPVTAEPDMEPTCLAHVVLER